MHTKENLFGPQSTTKETPEGTTVSYLLFTYLFYLLIKSIFNFYFYLNCLATGNLGNLTSNYKFSSVFKCYKTKNQCLYSKHN